MVMGNIIIGNFYILYCFLLMSYSSFQYQLSESLNKQKEGFQKLDELIADIHQRYLKIAKVSEQKILQNYQN